MEHVEKRTAHALANHPIPEIEDPRCRDGQPSRYLITIDKESALMSQDTFDSLNEYSCSNPTGVYPGKMWKRHNGVYDIAFIARGGIPTWLLCWYDYSEKGPDYCTTKYRNILIV